MTKRIRTYEDLMEENARLKELIAAQRNLLSKDIDVIKAEIQPVRKIISTIGKFTSREGKFGALTLAAETGIDVLLRRFFLSKSGFFTRLIVPFLVKNFSSHVIADNKDKILNKLFALFGQHRENGKAHHEETPSTAPGNMNMESTEEED